MNFEWSVTAAFGGIINSFAASVLLAGATLLLTRLAKGWNASTRYAVWWLCLIAILAAPLMRRASEQRAVVTRIAAADAPVAAPRAVEVRTLFQPPATRVIERESVQAGMTLDPRAGARAAAVIWFLGALWSLARLLRSYAWMRRARARCIHADDSERLVRCLALCPVKRRVRLYWSAEASVPLAAGFFRAAILLPERMAAHLSEREIDEIVIHELAHLARGDDWMQLTERFIGSLFWFHPPVRIALRRIAFERELCCDDWVIRSGGGVRSYAASLLKLAELRQSVPVPALAPAAAGGKAEVARRIEALLGSADLPGNKAAAKTRISGMRLAAMATVLSVLGGVGAHLPRLVRVAVPAFAVAPAAFSAPPPQAAPATAPAKTAPAAPAKTAPVAAAPGKNAPLAAPAKAPAPASRPTGFLAALTATGYNDLPVDEIINLKNNGITAEFLLEMHDAGIKLSTADLIRVKQTGLKPAYLREMRNTFPSLTIGEAIDLQNNGVKTSLAEAINTLGYGPYTPKDMIEMSVNGVSAEFFEALKDYGIKQIDARDAVRARQHGVNRKSLAEARQYGPSLTIAQIIKLKSAGVI